VSLADTLVENQRVASVLSAALTSLGEAHVVVSPGSRSTPLALAFERVASDRLHVVLDERAAAFLALGIARATGRPAIVLATSGSAGANHYPAVVEANVGRVPLVLVTANRPGELQDCGAPQTMPQRTLFGEHVRASIALPEPAPEVASTWLRNTALRALALATGSPAGPVHLDVPFREPLYDPDAEAPVVPEVAQATFERGELHLQRSAIARLADALLSEKSGAIVCGPWAPATVSPETVAPAVAELANELGWPIVADVTSGLRFGPHARDNVLSATGALLSDPDLAHALRVRRCLAFGQPPTLKSVGRFVASHRDSLTLVNPDTLWLDGGGNAASLLIAEPAPLCRDLATEVRRRREGGTSEGDERARRTVRWRKADAAASAVLARHASEGSWEGRVVHELVRSVSPGTRLHVASSMPIRDLDVFAGSGDRRLSITSNRGVNGIDGTIATALGIAVASASPTVALLGDLAFLHDLDGLEAASTVARESGARLALVVVDNGGGGIFGELPIGRHPSAFERLFLTPRPGDLVGVARALGARTARVEAADIGAALAEALGQDGVSVLHVTIDRAESSRRRKAATLDAAERARAEMFR